jgi:hypothetical protein
MDPYWDPDNNVTSDAFFANRRESELAKNEGDGLPPVNNNEAGRRLWWGGRILESVMDHMMEGDYPLLRYPTSSPRMVATVAVALPSGSTPPTRASSARAATAGVAGASGVRHSRATLHTHRGSRGVYRPVCHDTRLPRTQSSEVGGLRPVRVGE